MGELAAGAAARSVLYAKGATEDQANGLFAAHCYRYTSAAKPMAQLFGIPMQHIGTGCVDVVDLYGNSLFHWCRNQKPHSARTGCV